jgi:hypothetical protein
LLKKIVDGDPSLKFELKLERLLGYLFFSFR